jgi:hypothetical protein
VGETVPVDSDRKSVEKVIWANEYYKARFWISQENCLIKSKRIGNVAQSGFLEAAKILSFPAQERKISLTPTFPHDRIAARCPFTPWSSREIAGARIS